MNEQPLVDSWTVSMCLLVTHNLQIKPATIRTWARRGKIPTHGTGRYRYRVSDVQDYLQKEQILARSCTVLAQSKTAPQLSPSEEARRYG